MLGDGGESLMVQDFTLDRMLSESGGNSLIECCTDSYLGEWKTTLKHNYNW